MKSHASMNRSYRLIWSEATQSYCAVAETAKGAKKGGGARTLRRHLGVVLSGVLSSVALSTGLGSLTYAQQAPPGVNASAYFADVKVALLAPKLTQLPLLNNVAQGQVQISQSQADKSAAMTVNQMSDKAVLNWNSFNIGANAQVNFNQPSRTSVTLNRVLDASPSQIFGELNANGQVFLSNPNGIYFSPSAQVDVGGLVATTHAIADADFLSDKMQFDRKGSASGIVNEGHLNAKLGGYIALLAPEVQNSGVIVAQAGTVAMAAGEAVTLKFAQNHSLAGITTTPATIATLVENKLAVQAPGGQIILSALALNQLQAGVIKNSGTLEASSMVSRGGKIVLEGDDITLSSTSVINANGPQGGGVVLVGGDAEGLGELRHATRTVMAPGATIRANALDQGDGGKVVLFSDTSNALGITEVSGTVQAQGGANAGNGGQIETSGYQLRVSALSVSTLAPWGQYGTWLLDPYAYTIDAAAAANISAALVSSFVTIDTNNASSNGFAGTSTAGNANIVVSSPITRASGSGNGTATTLTLAAGTDIGIYANISGSSNNPLNVVLASRAHGEASGGVYIESYSSIKSYGGNITIGGGDVNASGYAIGGGAAGLAMTKAQDPMTGVSIIGTLDATANASGAAAIATATSAVNANSVTSAALPVATSGGNIVVRGQGSGTANTFSWGVRISNDATGGVGMVTGGVGTVSISGTGGNGGNNYAVGSVGVIFEAGSYVLANQGTITITGNQGTGGAAYGMASTESGRLIGTNGGLSIQGDSLLIRDGNLVFYTGQNSDIKPPVVTCVTGPNGCGATTPTLTIQGPGVVNLWGDANAWNTSVRNANTPALTNTGTFVSGTNSVNLVNLTSAQALGGFDTNHIPSSVVSVTSSTSTASYTPIYVQETITSGNYGNLIFNAIYLNTVGTSIVPGTGVYPSISGTPTYNISNTSSAGTYAIYYTGGLSLSGGTGNYILSPYNPYTSYVIKPLPVTLTGSKIYDGTQAASAASLRITNTVNNDVVTLSGSAASAVSSANANLSASLTNLTGLSINNTNYTLTGATGTFAINPVFVTVTGTQVQSKTYDGNTTASLSGGVLSAAFVGSDGFTLTQAGNFITSNVVMNAGNPIGVTVIANDSITPTGSTNANNYRLIQPSGLSAIITPRVVTVTGSSVANKYYDGTNIARITGGVLGNVVAGDALTLVQGGNFAQVGVGNGIAVAVNDILSGASASNYTIGAIPNLSAHIVQAPLVIKANDDAKFSGQSDGVSANGSVGYNGVSYIGLVNGESPAVLNASNITVSRSDFGVDGVGTHANVLSVSPLASINNANYAVSYQTGSYAIVNTNQLLVKLNNAQVTYGTAPTYSVASASYYTIGGLVDLTLKSEVSNGTLRVTEGAVLTTGNLVALNTTTSTSSNINVGTYPVALTGLLNPNPNLSNGVVVVGNLSVTQRSLNPVPTGVSKVFDGNALMTNLVFSLPEAISGDLLSVAGAGTYASYNATAAANLNYTITNVKLSGNDANNYYLANTVNTSYGPTVTGSNGQITPLPISMYGVTVYSASTAFVAALGNLYALNAVSNSPVSISGNATLVSPNAGQTTLVNTSGLSIDNSNYLINSTGTITVVPANLTLSGTKVYDGTTAITGSVLTASGVAGQSFTLSGSGTLASKNAGSTTLAGVGSLSLTANANPSSGVASNYYALSMATNTITVSKALASVVGSAGVYTYSGAAQSGTATATGFINTDSVTITGIATGTNAGRYASSLGITGADANNYQVAYTDNTITINPLPINVSVSVSKTYDASAVFSSGFVLAANAYSLASNAVSGTVTVSSANAANYNSVLSSTLVLSNANYSIGALTLAATINKANLTLSGSQFYTAATAVAGSSLTANGVAGQTFTVTGSGNSDNLLSKNVGVQTLNSVNGLSLGTSLTGLSTNYNALTSTGSSLTILAKPLAVVGEVVTTKTYDGLLSASINASSASLSGVVAGDAVTLSTAGVSGSFFAKNAAVSIAVSVTGNTISGADAGNYTVSQPVLSGTINKAPLGIAVSGVYNHSTTITPSAYTLTGLQTGDTITSLTSVSLNNANVSSNASNFVTAIASFVGTASMANYSLNTAANASAGTTTTNAVTLSPYALSLSISKVYNASTNFTNANTYTLSGTWAGDTLPSIASGSASTASANYGTYASFSSNALVLSSTNYSIGGVSASIAKAPLGLSITATYSASTTVVPSAFSFTGLQAGDTVTNISSAVVSNANVSGNGSSYFTSITLGVTSGSMSLNNYTLNTSSYNATLGTAQNTVTLNPAPLGLNITGTYSGTTSIAPSAVTATGLLGTDHMTLASVTLHDKNVSGNGSNFVTDYSLGAGSTVVKSNYALNTTYAWSGSDAPSTNKVTLSAANLTLSGTRVYDATTLAAGNTLTATGVNSETFTLLGAGDASNLVSGNVTVGTIGLSSLTGLSLGTSANGGIASNYNALTTVGSSLSITKAPLGVTINAVYSGSTTVVPTSFAVSGLKGGEQINAITSALVRAQNVSANASNYLTSITLSAGSTASMSNYALNASYNVSGLANTYNAVTLSQAPLGITATGVYNGTQVVTPATYTLTGLLGLDTVSTISTLSVSQSNVASNGSIYVTAITLGSVSASMSMANYVLNPVRNATLATSSSNDFNFNAKGLSLSISKTYDANATFTNANPYAITGTLYANDAAPTIVSGAATTSSANAQTYASLSSNTFALSNTNYVIGAVTATINKAPLGITASALYSGSTTVVPNSFQLTGLQGGESVSSITSLVLSNANVANNSSNYVSQINTNAATALMSNYVLNTTRLSNAQQTNTNQITLSPAPLGVNAAGVFNATLNVVPTSFALYGLLGLDTVGSLTGLGVANANVAANGSNYVTSITLGTKSSSMSLSNYTLTANYNAQPSSNVSNVFTMSAAPLNLAISKTYDGLNTFATTNTYAFTGTAYAGDAYPSLVSGSASVSSANANVSPYTSFASTTFVLSNTNYAISGVSALINKAPLGISITAPYSSTTTVVPSSFVLTGLQNNETVSAITAAVINNANVAANASNYVSAITLGAHSALMSMSNYTLTLAPNAVAGGLSTNAVQLSPAPLGISASGVYSGSTTLVPSTAPSVTGLLGAQTLSVASLVISNPNVGNNNYVTQINPNGLGTTAVMSNYYVYPSYNNVTPLVSSTNVFTVTPASLTLSGSMVYSASTALAGAFLTATGVNGQTFSITGSGNSGNIASPAATTTPISLLNTTGLALGVSNNGGLASNYAALSSLGSSFTISKAPIGISVVGTYSGTTTLTPSQAPVITGLQGGQVFSIASVVVNAPDVASNTSNYVKSITLSGAGSTASLSNYQLSLAYSALDNTSTSNNVTINPKALSVSAVAANKTYDANVNATVTLSTSDAVAGQSVSFNNTFATFASKNTGLQTVSVSGIGMVSVLNGSLSNYTLSNTTATSSATIAAATLNVTATTNTKVYDGTTSALAVPMVTGLLGTDTATGTQVYANKNVGVTNTLTPSVVINDGNAGHNYQVVSHAINGTITPAPLIISAVADAKFVTQSDTLGYAGVSYLGFVGGDGVAQLSATPTVTRSNAAVQDTGTYSRVLVPSVVTSGNYTIAYVPGDYTIAPAGSVLVRSNNMSVSYGTPLSFNPSSVSYMSSNGNTISNLSLSSHTGNQFTYTDNAQGAITFTLQAVPLAQGAPSLSTGGQLVVGSYNIAATSYQTVLNHFTNAPVYVGGLTITPLSIAASASPSKTYDGTSLMTQANLSLNGVLANDVVSVTGSGVYSTVNASASVAYTVSGLTLLGADQGNYVLGAGANLSGNNGLIVPKNVTLTPASASKVYDATTAYTASAADLSALSAQLGVSNDGVSAASLTYASSAVGTNKTLHLSAVTLSDGNNGHNYNVSLASNTSSTITPASLSVLNTSVVTKTYDGTNTATLSGGVLNGVFAGDTVTLSQAGAFTDVNANANIAVMANDTLAGLSASNYRLIQPLGLSGTIAPKLVSVSGTSVSDKVYDGLSTAQVTSPGAVTGLVGNESLGLLANASFADASAGAQKSVNVSYTLLNGTQGGLARNYTVGAGTTLATIAKAPLTITVNDASKFVTQSDPVGFNGVTYSGLVNGEFASVITQGTISHPTASCSVTPTCTDLVAGIYAITPSGFSSSNYQISAVGGQFNVVPAGKLVIQVPNAVNVYGGNINFMPSVVQYATNAGATINNLSLAGITGSTYTYLDATGASVSFNMGVTPVVNQASGIFSSASQLKAGSYTYAYTNFINNGANLTAGVSPVIVGALTVNPLGLSVAAAPSRAYDGTSSVGNANMTLQGRVSGDVVSVSGSGVYATSNAGQNLGYTLSNVSLAGTDAANYYLFSGSTLSGNNGVIAAKQVTLNAPVVLKTYDASTVAQASVADVAALTQALNVQGNSVSSVSLSFDNKNAGTQKVVSINSATVLDGNNGQNFSITFAANALSAIAAAPLSVSALTNSKVYDGSVMANVLPTVSGLMAGDSIQVAQNYVSPRVLGVNASSLVPSVVALNDGNNGGNYVVSLSNALGTITPKPLGVAPLNLSKVYDASATIAGLGVDLTGVVGQDDVVARASGAFSSSNVGTGLAYALNSLVLAGASAANYVPQANFNYANSNGAITPAPITLSATKVYDGTTAMPTQALTASGVAGQTLNLSAGSAQTNSANVGGANALNTLTGLVLANGTGLASNYTVAGPQIGGVSITPAPLTLTASDAVKNFDGTTAMTGATTVPGPLLVSGTLYNNASNGGIRDSFSGGIVAFTDPAPGDKNKSTVLSGVVINDGNAGANYSITYVRNTTSTVVAPAPPPPTLTNAQVTTLSSAQITTLTSEQIQNLTPPQIAALTLSQLAGLTGYQINLFSQAQVQAFTPPQIAAFVPAQVNALTGTQLTAMNNAQLGAFTSTHLGLFTSAQLAALGNAQLQVLTPVQLSGITPTQLSLLSAVQLQALSGTQFAALQPSSVGALSSAQITALSSAQVQSMTPAQLATFSSSQFGALSTPMVQSLTPTQVGGLSARVISGLPSVVLAGFSNAQLQGLIASQMTALTPLQVNALTPSQWGVISANQFAAISPTTVAGLGAAQLSQLNATQLQSLSASQMSSLSAQQLAVFNATQIASMGSGAFAGLSNAQVTSLAGGFLQAMTGQQVAALPANQVTLLSPAQLGAFRPAQVAGFTATQVAAFSPNQMASMQATQLASLSPESLGVLTPAQLGVLSGAQIQAFTPSQVAALSTTVVASMSMGQVASLISSQVQSFTLSQVGVLQAPQIAALSPQVVSQMSPAQIGALNAAQLVGLSKSQITVLSGEQVSGLTPLQLSALSVAQLTFLSTSQISALTPGQLSGLSSTQLAVLSVPPVPLQSQPINSGNNTSSGVGQNNASSSLGGAALTPSNASPNPSSSATSLTSSTLPGATTGLAGALISPGNANSSAAVAPASNSAALAPTLMANGLIASTPLNAPSGAVVTSLPSFNEGAGAELSIGNAQGNAPPLQAPVQTASTPPTSMQSMDPQAQGPPILQATVGAGAGNGLVVNVLKVPTPSTTGLIAVVLPQGTVNLNSVLTIPLPEQAIVIGADVKISLPSNESLPSWISYNPQSQAFEAKGVPIGGLPLTVVVDSGAQRTLILLSESSSK